MSNQVGHCFKFMWPFQNVRTLPFSNPLYIQRDFETIYPSDTYNLKSFGLLKKNLIATKFFEPPRMLTLLSFKSITIGVNTCLNRTPLSGFIRCHTFLSSFPKENAY